MRTILRALLAFALVAGLTAAVGAQSVSSKHLASPPRDRARTDDHPFGGGRHGFGGDWGGPGGAWYWRYPPPGIYYNPGYDPNKYSFGSLVDLWPGYSGYYRPLPPGIHFAPGYYPYRYSFGWYYAPPPPPSPPVYYRNPGRHPGRYTFGGPGW